jgi:REP element-mobilizing transposase RayT
MKDGNIIMPRYARKRSKTGVYHVIARGINRQKIFHEDNDYKKYLGILYKTKEKTACEIYGYCLMSNHVHLLIKENDEEIGQIMKRIGISYASWYNWKYERIGHLFQNRYKSECVEDDKYLITVIRYIHNNPVKAKMVGKPEQYNWSSINAYYDSKKEYIENLTQTDNILKMFSEYKDNAVKQFREFMEQENEDDCLEEGEEIRRISDQEAKKEVKKILKGKSISELRDMNKYERNKILSQVKDLEGISIRQICRLTGIGYYIVFRADKMQGDNCPCNR